MKKTILSSLGMVGGLIAATSCCWLPLALVAVGAGGAAGAFGKFVAKHHWIFLAGAVVVLGTAAYFIYLRSGGC